MAKILKRKGAVRLPIVDVDVVLEGLTCPNTAKSLIGVQRQVVEKVVQTLRKAKRDQIDGEVMLDQKDIGLLLQAMSLSLVWFGDLLYFNLPGDE